MGFNKMDIYHNIDLTVSSFLSTTLPIGRVWFANQRNPTSQLAFKVDFPRLEIVIDGALQDNFSDTETIKLQKYDVLYILAGCWNYPQWLSHATTLSILFGKQKLGFSLQHWDGNTLCNISKQNVDRRGPRVGSFLLQALNDLSMRPQNQTTAKFIISSLLSDCNDLLSGQTLTSSKSQNLFEAICIYIDENFSSPLTRSNVAHEFNVSPNYLSYLFQKNGAIGFNEYLNHTRLEQAKLLLKGYEFKIKEVAHACGFVDSNYFCRLFRKITERSPSNYRQQYHSILDNKNTNF